MLCQFDEDDFKVIIKQFKQREEDIAYLKSILQQDTLCSQCCQRSIVAIQFQKDQYRRGIEENILNKYTGSEILNKTPEHTIVVDFAEKVDAIREISKAKQKAYKLISNFEDQGNIKMFGKGSLNTLLWKKTISIFSILKMTIKLSQLNFTKELLQLKQREPNVKDRKQCSSKQCIRNISRKSIFYDYNFKEIDLEELHEQVKPKKWIIQNQQPLKGDILKLNFNQIYQLYEQIQRKGITQQEKAKFGKEMLKELLIDNDVISDQIRKYSQDYGVYHKKRRLREIKKLKLKKREKYLIDDLKQRQIRLRVNEKSKTYADFSRQIFLSRCIQSRKQKRRIKTKLNSPNVVFSFRNQEEEKLDSIRRQFQGDKLKLNNDDTNVKIKLFNAQQTVKQQHNSFSLMQSNNMNLTNNSEDESEKNDSFHLSSEDSDEASNLLRVNSSYTNKRPEEQAVIIHPQCPSQQARQASPSSTCQQETKQKCKKKKHKIHKIHKSQIHVTHKKKSHVRKMKKMSKTKSEKIQVKKTRNSKLKKLSKTFKKYNDRQINTKIEDQIQLLKQKQIIFDCENELKPKNQMGKKPALKSLASEKLRTKKKAYKQSMVSSIIKRKTFQLNILPANQRILVPLSKIKTWYSNNNNRNIPSPMLKNLKKQKYQYTPLSRISNKEFALPQFGILGIDKNICAKQRRLFRVKPINIITQSQEAQVNKFQVSPQQQKKRQYLKKQFYKNFCKRSRSLQKSTVVNEPSFIIQPQQQLSINNLYQVSMKKNVSQKEKREKRKSTLNQMYNISVKERSTGHIRQRNPINFIPIQGKDINKPYQSGIISQQAMAVRFLQQS